MGSGLKYGLRLDKMDGRGMRRGREGGRVQWDFVCSNSVFMLELELLIKQFVCSCYSSIPVVGGYE